MGKTWLIDRIAHLATQHPSLQCAWVRYEVTADATALIPRWR